MIRMLQKIVLFFSVLLASVTGTHIISYAGPVISINMEIDNASEYPAEVAAMSSYYVAEFVTEMKTVKSNVGYQVVTSMSNSFKVQNGKQQTYTSPNGTMNVWFKPNASTDPHLSLKSVVYTAANNFRQYTYYPDGKTTNPNPVKSYNWIELINRNNPASVTLHFQYNPDIDKVPGAPDPDPAYNKKIDYLGDGVSNPDTTQKGPNDYRLYLDFMTQPETQSNKADIVFVLDVSGSMDTAMSGKTRMAVLKETMITSINTLTQNPQNRISIIKFSQNSSVLVSASSNKTALTNAVNGLTAGGVTNYYASLTDAKAQINSLIGSDTMGREKVVIFITDGEPTYSTPIMDGYYNYQANFSYAFKVMNEFPTLDRFYSIYIGSSKEYSSYLQNITQMSKVRKEKFMVQATSSDQVTNTMARFMASMGNALYNVSISDVLSSYVSYKGGLKVTRQTNGGTTIILSPGIDYSIAGSVNNVLVKLLNQTIPNTKYTVSFNVRSSDAAMDYYDLNQSYPHTGDIGTDYLNNITSSGKTGFFSNSTAKLSYDFGGGSTFEKTYQKPVVQVVQPEPVKAEINVKKILTGKELREGMFSFEIIDVTGGRGVIETLQNESDGSIRYVVTGLDQPGSYVYQIREVIPATAEPGMTYDPKTIQITIVVKRQEDELVTEVKYPSQAVFENKYKPAPVDVIIKANKVLTGKILTADMFEFSLLTSMNALMETATNAADGKITFSPVRFTEAGTYVYLIRETLPIPLEPNMKYDHLKEIIVTISVTDQNGVLVAGTQYSEEPTFINRFGYTPTSATIELQKVLTGMQLSKDMFEFEIKETTSLETKKIKNNGQGKVLFDYTYTEPGSFEYEVKELRPNTPINYMTYDEKVITVTVDIVENEDTGELEVTVTYSEDPIFYNSYQVRGGIW